MSQSRTLTGKTVWLTGASSGIGLALCELLLQNGNRVIATVRNRDALSTLADRWPAELFVIDCDLSDKQQLEKLPLVLSGITRHIDALVLSAGVCEYVDDATVLDSALFRRVMEVNYFAAIECCQIAMPFLLAANSRPLIMGVSSLSTKSGFSRAEAYGSSKAAFHYFLNSLHIDLKGQVDVCIVSPGFVKTPMTDKNDFSMPFLVTAERAAAEIFKAMIKRRRHVSFPKRLDYLLGLLGFIPALWYGVIAPGLKKTSATEA